MKTHISRAEGARRDRLQSRYGRARVERGSQRREDGLALLLAALVGDGLERADAAGLAAGTQRESPPRRGRAEVSAAHHVASPPAFAGPRAGVSSADAPASRASASVRHGAAKMAMPSGGERRDAANTFSLGSLVATDRAGVEERPAHNVERSSPQEDTTTDIGRTAPGQAGSLSHLEPNAEMAMESAMPSADWSIAPSESHFIRHDSRLDLLNHVQEMLRDESARANEERERRELASSRARLACFG